MTNTSPFHPKFLDFSSAKEQREKLKAQNKVYVFTNGCFDLLHPGHVDYLQRAKDLGDYLMVGLNSDDSIRRLKGELRPINSQDDRATMLSSLAMVDGVVIFGEDTPLQLIQTLKPDILVKGGDWKPQDIVGGQFTLDNGGQVLSLPYLNGYSTTQLIQRIISISSGVKPS
jgi:D-beta-D-heptose 7-phosphate kinase/D-beta-D-heptose 1-phosphate adenosyltransferase